MRITPALKIGLLTALGFASGCASHVRKPEPVKQEDVARKLGFPNDSPFFLEQIASLPGGYQTRWPLVRRMEEIAAIYSGRMQVEETKDSKGNTEYIFYLMMGDERIPPAHYTSVDVAQASTQETKTRVYREADTDNNRIITPGEIDQLRTRVLPKYARSKT